jgi:hypothetical protein
MRLLSHEPRQLRKKIRPDYLCANAYQTFWEIPKTLKKGEKIEVLLIWETELFGKLEAKKERILEDITPAP